MKKRWVEHEIELLRESVRRIELRRSGRRGRHGGMLMFAGIGIAALHALPTHAAEGDTFRPFVSYTYYYDSNLYRLDDSEFSLVREKSDQYSVLSAGLNVDWRPGRQQVLASASKSFVRFSRYDNLDYDGSDYQLRWNWRLGNHWSGRVGGTEKVTQSNLGDQLGLPVNNEITKRRAFADAAWQFHPRWSIGAGAATVESTNSASSRTALDYEEDSVTATLGYKTPKGSKLSAQLRRAEGEYPNRVSPLLDPEYTQTEYNLLGDWTLTGKLIAHGRIGYVQREHDTLGQRDFSGVAGRLSADYAATGKTTLSAAVYREVANSDVLNATYQVNTGTSLGAAWRATSKITVNANAKFENRAFEGDPGGPIVGDQRDDDTVSGTLSVGYSPIEAATIEVGMQAGKRDSNISAYSYEYHAAFVSVRGDF